MKVERIVLARIGAVVAKVNCTIESPLPVPTCAGLNVHVVNAGSLEHENVTLLGKLPVVGFTSMLKTVGCPAGIDALGGAIPIVKLKF
jgi:hypothetical protein